MSLSGGRPSDIALHILSRAETSLDVCRPADEIYAYLLDFKRHTEWAHTLLSIEPVTAGAATVGSRFRAQHRQDWKWDKRPFTTLADRVEGIRFESESEITEIEQGRRIAWRERMVDGPFEGAWEFVLEPIDDGMTTVRLRGRVTGPLEASKQLLEDLQASGYPVDVVARQADRSMHNIRTILEGRAAPRA